MSFALFLFILFVGGLFGFHVFCIATNQTTWEIASKRKISYLRGVPENVHAFDRGPAKTPRVLLPPAAGQVRHALACGSSDVEQEGDHLGKPILGVLLLKDARTDDAWSRA